VQEGHHRERLRKCIEINIRRGEVSTLVIDGQRNLFYVDYHKDEKDGWTSQIVPYDTENKPKSLVPNRFHANSNRQGGSFHLEIQLPADIDDSLSENSCKIVALDGLYAIFLANKPKPAVPQHNRKW